MKKASARGAQITTLIGTGTTVVGDVRFTGGLHLEGRVEGNVEAADEHTQLDVSEGGYVVGEVRVGTVVVNGAVEGDIHADVRLVLGPRAHIDGNVYYKVLEMSAGAAVNGKLIHQPRSERLALEHQRDNIGKETAGSESGSSGIAAEGE